MSGLASPTVGGQEELGWCGCGCGADWALAPGAGPTGSSRRLRSGGRRVGDGSAASTPADVPRTVCGSAKPPRSLGFRGGGWDPGARRGELGNLCQEKDIGPAVVGGFVGAFLVLVTGLAPFATTVVGAGFLILAPPVFVFLAGLRGIPVPLKTALLSTLTLSNILGVWARPRERANGGELSSELRSSRTRSRGSDRRPGHCRTHTGVVRHGCDRRDPNDADGAARPLRPPLCPLAGISS